jgi:hypothetical protein
VQPVGAQEASWRTPVGEAGKSSQLVFLLDGDPKSERNCNTALIQDPSRVASGREATFPLKNIKDNHQKVRPVVPSTVFNL